MFVIVDVPTAINCLRFHLRAWDLPNNKFRKWVLTCCACYVPFTLHIGNPNIEVLATKSTNQKFRSHPDWCYYRKSEQSRYSSLA